MKGRVLITGGTGFFGKALVQANPGFEITVLTRNAKYRNPAVNVIVGDVRTFTTAQEFTHIIHAATESASELNETAPEEMVDVIVRGTAHVLRLARAGTRFLYVSSGAVYGKQPSEITHVSETYFGGPDPLAPGSAYAESKRMAELITMLAGRRGVEGVIARPFAFVGPHMKLDGHFAIGNFIHDAVVGRSIIVNGDGTPMRSYMYTTDLAEWLWAILLRGRVGQAYNVGSDEDLNIAELAHTVARIAGGVPVEIKGTPVAGAKPARYVPSVEKVRRELGLTINVPLEQAILKTMEWAR